MDDIEHQRLYICVRTSDLAEAPGGVKGNCTDCGAEIWHKPYAPDDIKKVCVQCVFPHIKDSDRVIMLPGWMAPRKYHS